MIRNKYKIEKKSKLELAQEDAAARASDIKDAAADTVKEHPAPTALAALGTAAAAALASGLGSREEHHTTDELPGYGTARTSERKDHGGFVDEIVPLVLKALVGMAAAGTTATAAKAAADSDTDMSDMAKKAADTVSDIDVAGLVKGAAGLLGTKKAKDAATDDEQDEDVDVEDLTAKAAAAGISKKKLDKAAKRAYKREDKRAAVQAKLDAEQARLEAQEAQEAKTAKAAKKAKKAEKRENKSGGGMLITLGLLATAGAVAAVAYRRTTPQDDPWATPLADPYTGPESTTIGSAGTGTVGTSTMGTRTEYSTPSTTTSYGSRDYGTDSSVDLTDAKPLGSRQPAGDPLSAVSTEPVVLDAKDQEDFAATTPSTAIEFDRADDGAGQHLDHNAGSDKRANDI